MRWPANRWGRVTYEMMESYWLVVARGAMQAPSAIHEWEIKLEAKPKYVGRVIPTPGSPIRGNLQFPCPYLLSLLPTVDRWP